MLKATAKAQNLTVEEARKTFIKRMRDEAQSERSPVLQQLVGPLSQFIETPGSTLKVMLSPKDSVTVLNAITSLISDPDGLLTDFNLAIAVRPPRLVEPK